MIVVFRAQLQHLERRIKERVMKLLVLEDDYGLAGEKFFRRSLFQLAQRKLSQGYLVVGPEFLKASLPNAFSWTDIKNLADCQQENYEELFAFNKKASAILAEDQSVTFQSVIRALAFGFMASHSEDFPFFVSGLQAFLRIHGVDSLELEEYSPLPLLAADVAKAQHISIQWPTSRRLRTLSQSFFRRLRSATTSLLQTGKQMAYFLSAPSGSGSADILCIVSKERSRRVFQAIAKEASKSGNSFRYFNAPVMEHSPEEWHPTKKWTAIAAYWTFFFSALAVWRRHRHEIRELPYCYRGVPIGPHHFRYMGEILFQRGPAAAFAHSALREDFRARSPKAIFTIDPLELSILATEAAREANIPSVFYYSIYNGWLSTAALWEKNAARASHVLALNSWMAERARPLSLHSTARAVGDALRVNLSLEEKQKGRLAIAHRLGLDPQKKWLLLLTRQVSSALSAADKEVLIRESLRTAETLGAQLIVKGHPYENRDQLLREVAGKAPVVIQEFPLDLLVATVDLVINTPSSASSLDAFYAQTPVLIYGPSALFDYLDRLDGPLAYRKNKAGAVLYTGDPMEMLVRDLLEKGEKRREAIRHGLDFAEKVVGDKDGLAAARIAEELAAVIRQ